MEPLPLVPVESTVSADRTDGINNADSSRRDKQTQGITEILEPLTLVPVESTVSANRTDGTDNAEPNERDMQKNGAQSKAKFDPDFTKNVINATGPKASPRIRKVMASLIQHVHDFARENEITVDEWMAGVELINSAGRMSDDRRNEGLLLCDVIGLESLIDEITFKLASDAADVPTSSAILGPFWRKDAPRYEMGSSIVHGIDDGDHTLMYGTVVDYLTGEPIEGAELDVWHTAPNGLYEQQDENQVDFNLRGRFTTGKDGKYNFYCLRPTSYPIPFDGPAGKLLQLLDRHPMRPAHIHFIVSWPLRVSPTWRPAEERSADTAKFPGANHSVVQVSAPGYKPLITQIFDRRDKHITDDAVFAVKDSLVVDFLPRKGDPKADFELPYDFKLATFDEAQKNSLVGATEESASYEAGLKHG